MTSLNWKLFQNYRCLGLQKLDEPKDWAARKGKGLTHKEAR